MFLSNIPNLVPAGISARWSSPEKVGPLISHLNPLTLYPFLRVRWSLHVSTRPYSHLSGLGEGGPTCQFTIWQAEANLVFLRGNWPSRI
jgi:hypothetical protein